MKKFCFKFLSTLLALTMVLTAVIVPSVVVSASAEAAPADNASSRDYFFVDYTKEGAFIPTLGQVYTDEDGNEFYPFNYCQGYSSKMTLQQKDITVDGNAAKTLDIQSVVTSSDPNAKAGAWNFIPQDENGKPFVMAPGATYKITVKIRKKAVASWEKMYVGGGVLASKVTSTSTRVYNGTMNDAYTWTDAYEGRIEFPSRPESSAPSSLFDRSSEVILAYNSGEYLLDTFDGIFTGAASSVERTITTYNTPYVNNSVSIVSGDTTYNYAQYFAISDGHTGFIHSVDNGDGTVTKYYNGMCIDSVEIQRLVSFTLDAGEGTVNGSKTASVSSLACGDALPGAYKANAGFKGWYFDADLTQPVGDYITSAIDGKTLYAKYGSGLTIDWDHGEFGSKSSNYFDTEGNITTDATNNFKASSWFPSWDIGARTNSIGYSQNKVFGVGTSDNKYNGSGGTLLNNGSNLVFVEPGKTYRLKYNVYYLPNKTNRMTINFGPSLGANWTAAKDRISSVTRIANTGINLFADSNEFTYYYNGEQKTGTDGKWYACSDIFTVPEVSATSTKPLPYALAIGGSFCGDGKYMFMDDFVLEEYSAITFVDGANGVNYTVDGGVGDAVTPPSVTNENAEFLGWYNADGTPFTDTVFTDSLSAKTVYAKWRYSKLSMSFENNEIINDVHTHKEGDVTVYDTSSYYTGDCIINKLTGTIPDTSSKYVSYSYFTGSGKKSVTGADGKSTNVFVLGAGNDNSWGNPGGLIFNDGTNVFVAEAGKTYRITYKVFLTTTGTLLGNQHMEIGINPKWDKTGSAGRLTTFNTSFENTGVQMTTGSDDFIYHYNGEAKNGTAGVWYNCSDTITVDSIAKASTTNPIPAVLGFCGGGFGQGKYLYVDDVVVEEVYTITFDARNGEVFSTTGCLLGDAITIPEVSKENATFAGWYNDDNTPFTDTEITIKNGNKTVYAKWNYDGNFFIDFDGDELFRTEKTIWYEGTDYTANCWSGSDKKNYAGKGKDGTYAYGAAFSGTAYSQAGCYPLNDGYDFITLDASSLYKIELDVNSSDARGISTPLKIGYGGLLTAANGAWGALGNYGNYHLSDFSNAASVVVGDAENHCYNSTDDYGTHTTPDGNWVHLVYTLETPADFNPQNKADYPIPNQLILIFNRIKHSSDNVSSSVFVDNISIKKLNADENVVYDVTDTQNAAILNSTATRLVNANKGAEIHTSVADITVNKAALNSIKTDASSKDNITFAAANISDGTYSSVTNFKKAVSIKVNNGDVTSFGGETITVDVPVDDSFVAGETYVTLEYSENAVVPAYLGGKCILKDGKKYISFNTKGLSDFVITFDTVRVNGLNLTVGGDLSLNIYAQLPESIKTDGNAKFYIKRTNNSYTVTSKWNTNDVMSSDEYFSLDGASEITASKMSGAGVPENTYKITYPGITPQLMNATVMFVVKCGDTVVYSRATSVREYCDSAYEKADAMYTSKPKADAFKVWLADLLEYGTAAQKYITPETPETEYANYDFAGSGNASTFATVSGAEHKVTGDGSENAYIYSLGLRFENANRLKFVYKTKDASKTKFIVTDGEGNEVRLQVIDDGNYQYTCYTPLISALNFDMVYTAKLSFNDEELQTATYSVKSYVQAKQESSTLGLANLVKRLYCYGLSSQAFVNA